MAKDLFVIDDVIENGLCIGCGNCAARYGETFSMVETEFGLIQAVRVKENGGLASSVCPFANSSKDEDYFNSEYKRDSLGSDVGVGFYRGVFAGYVNDPERRLASSSGGLVTFLIEKLLERKLITGAVVVIPLAGGGGRLQYKIVRSAHELAESRKSKYHMVSNEGVVREILAGDKDDQLIFVGVPCGVKAIKLLAEEEPEVKRRIKYTAAIFCGHQKSHAFSEYVAWQIGVPPGSLRSINYRLKEPSEDASKYYYQVSSDLGGSLKARVDSLRWMDWGLGLFKPKACDFCDDVAGEAADIIFGDAWHRKYSKDYRGANIVLTRSAELEGVLVEGAESGLISLHKEEIQFVYDTQGGNFRHRQEGLISRVKFYTESGLPVPPKSTSRHARYKHNPARDKIYILRHVISAKSHIAFLRAKEKGDLNLFWDELSPEINLYFKKTRSIWSDFKRAAKKILFFR